MLEAISARLEIITGALERTAGLVEANTEQVATLTEHLTRMENLMEKGFANLETLIQQQLELSRQQHETAQMQGRHIDRLMSITETLIQQRVA